MLPIESHDGFLELCALSTSGRLTDAEEKWLEEHLTTCSSCRNAKEQFEVVVDRTIPAIFAHEPAFEVEGDTSWSIEAVELEFFSRLATEQQRPEANRELADNPILRASPSEIDTAWRHVWALYAAGILLIISLAFSAHRFGMHRSPNARTSTLVRKDGNSQTTFRKDVAEISQQPEALRVQIALRDNLLADLRRELQQRSMEMRQIKLALKKPDNQEIDHKTRQDFTHRQAELDQKLSAAQTEVQALRAMLDSLQEQSSQDSSRATTLQAKVDDLTKSLEDKEAEVRQQQQLLARDRDIRELMGARDLYMTEVYDVARSGETQKPFGRVFYTNEKSLIFYAYDLDQEAGLKNASTFQAWGRRGPDRSQALNLGIFYEDNASKKRWVLKFNDPKTLAQIDAVFVTIEPDGGSRKPSGKPLLFAYLKIDPNHP